MKNGRERERSYGNFLPVAVGLLFVIGAGLLAYFVFFANPKNAPDSGTSSPVVVSPESVAEPGNDAERFLLSYMAMLDAGDYAGMHACLDTTGPEMIGTEEFIERHKNIYEGIDATDIHITIHSSNIPDGESALIIYQTAMESEAGPISFVNQVELSREPGKEYKLKWNSTCIFPQLKEGFKVRNNSVKSVRGTIYDRNNIILAGNGKAGKVGFVPGRMNSDPAEDIQRVAELMGVEAETIRKSLQASYVGPDTFVPIRSISESEMDVKSELMEIAGIQINEENARIYPMGASAAHLTGYVQIINAEELDEMKDLGYDQNSLIGKVGLESLYEADLRGKDGREIVIVDENNVHITTLAYLPARNGSNIKLTIDSSLQNQIFSGLSEEKSCTVAMNPKTGEMLALVSTPSYDPNRFSLGLLNAEWEALRDDPKNPMFNRFRGSYVPGSSFKPVTAGIGISTQTLNPTEDFGSSGNSWQADSSWRDYYVTTLATYGGPANFANALMYSDNIYFAKAALRIGGETFSSSLLALGFGEAFPFEITLAPSIFSQGAETMLSGALLANTGYGQADLLLNPVHFSAIYSAFNNEGDILCPYILFEETVTPQIWKSDAFSDDAAATVREAMIQVIENPSATGHDARLDGTLLAGKTGTAEIKDSQTDTSGTELGWFAAFTAEPSAAKPIQVITMIEDVKGRGGSHFVIPFVRDTLSYYIGS